MKMEHECDMHDSKGYYVLHNVNFFINLTGYTWWNKIKGRSHKVSQGIRRKGKNGNGIKRKIRKRKNWVGTKGDGRKNGIRKKGGGRKNVIRKLIRINGRSKFFIIKELGITGLEKINWKEFDGQNVYRKDFCWWKDVGH